jgi:hypothetical protein
MKALIQLLLVAAFLVTTASAQLGAPSVVVAGTYPQWTNAIVANSTYTTNAVIDCTRSRYVNLVWKAELSGAGTTANTLVVQQSVDNSNWATYQSYSMTPAGTTAVIVSTNLDVAAIPYLRVRSIANASANTGAITNYTVKVFQKN